jgi:hypothetical protein
MLMSFQYGLNIIPSERDQFYYRELAPQQNLTLNTQVLGLFETLYVSITTFFGVNVNGSGVASFSSLGALSTQASVSDVSTTSN